MTISVDRNSNLYASWADHRNGQAPCLGTFPPATPPCNHDVFYSFSTDRGRTFDKNVRVTDRIIDRNIGVWSNNAHSQTSVAVTSSDTTTYVAWQDSRNGNAITNVEDIYFAAVQFPVDEDEDDDRVPGWVVVVASAAVGMGVAVVLALAVTRRGRAAGQTTR